MSDNLWTIISVLYKNYEKFIKAIYKHNLYFFKSIFHVRTLMELDHIKKFEE